MSMETLIMVGILIFVVVWVFMKVKGDRVARTSKYTKISLEEKIEQLELKVELLKERIPFELREKIENHEEVMNEDMVEEVVVSQNEDEIK